MKTLSIDKIKFLVGVLTITLTIMFLYELVKETLLPGLTLWQSHLITIAFSSVIATAAAFLLLIWYEKKTETVHFLAEQRFKNFAEVGADRFWETDKNHRITFHSPPIGELVLPVDNLIGKLHWEVEGREPSHGTWAELKEKFYAHQPFRNLHYTWTRDDGSVRHLMISGVPFYDETNNFLGYRGAIFERTKEVEAQEKIKTVQQRLFEALEGLNAGVILWDENDCLITCNNFYRDNLSPPGLELKQGLTFEEFIRKRSEFVDFQEDQNVEDWIAERIATHKDPISIFERKFKNGKWFRIRKQKLPDNTIITFQTDITELKQQEEAIKKSEERLRTIVEASPIPLVITRISDGKILYANEHVGPIFNLSNDEVIGKQAPNFWSNPEHRNAYIDKLKSKGWLNGVEVEMKKADGETMWASVSSRLMDFQGEEAIVTGFTDVTYRKKSEETIRNLSSAVEQSPNAVFITDMDGTIEYVNSSFTKLTGYTAGEALGQNPRILKSGETPRELYTDLWNTIQSGKEWRGEIKDRHKNGSHFWAYETIAPVKDKHGVVTHYVATHEDITQRKEAEISVLAALEEADIANRAKSELLANMSHELRTPLNAIIGFSESIKQEIFGPLGNEKYREYIADISDSGQHLLELITDILDVSAIEAGKLELHEERLEIDQLVDASVRIVKHRAKIKKVRLSIEIDDGLPQLYADERRIKQIFLNLLSNAVKFTPPEGSVALKASLDDGNALIFTVADTGIGMNKLELIKAMTQFGQVDRGKKTQHEGTGLGLPLTKGLVELHGGSIEITSEKDVGTTVFIRFPKERIVSGS